MAGVKSGTNKISQYLNQHLMGEVTNSSHICEKFATDGSILSITPSLVIYPKVTNDIRKIARFCWQLAEKGHNLSITMRGNGSNTTGAAIGDGIIVSSSTHLNDIIFLSTKKGDQFVHVQPGIRVDLLLEVLKSHDLTIPALETKPYHSVGGIIADGRYSHKDSNFGPIYNWIDGLEVVLANGDLIETSRLNKHELNKKKGLQTFEGEIYRKIDGIIDDNQEMINNLDPSSRLSYSSISQVKRADGSFDLTPLIIGSQGTLGIISETIFKVHPASFDESIIIATFDSTNSALETAKQLIDLRPSKLDIIDGELFEMASKSGQTYIFNKDSDKDIASLMFIRFDDANDRIQKRDFQKAIKLLAKTNATILDSENNPVDDLKAIQNVFFISVTNEADKVRHLPIIGGSAIPTDRIDEFITDLDELAKKHSISLPFKIDYLSGIFDFKTSFNLHTVADKQKTFRLMTDYMDIVVKNGGTMLASHGEGRLKTLACYNQADKTWLEIFDQIKTVFDPFNVLNPGIKQSNSLKTLVSQLNANYSSDIEAKYADIN